MLERVKDKRFIAANIFKGGKFARCHDCCGTCGNLPYIDGPFISSKKHLMEEIAVQQQPSGVFISKSVHFAFCICVLFAVPFLIPGPQLLVGSIVNFVLIAAAMRYRSRHIILPLAMVPSLAVVLNGLMFGSFTLFMVYLMPIIRIGNIVLMLSIQRMKYLRGGIYFGGFLKASLIFIGAYVLVHIGVIPDMFLTMGMIQMITILIGGSGAQLLKKYL